MLEYPFRKLRVPTNVACSTESWNRGRYRSYSLRSSSIHFGLGINAYSAAECASWAAGLRRDRYRQAMLSGGETYIVAEVGNNLVAFCSYKSDEIIGLYVDPLSSRKGIGSLLLQKAEEQISTKRPISIRLNAALSALGFYEMQGYRTTNRKKWKTRGGLEIDVYEMKKDIS